MEPPAQQLRLNDMDRYLLAALSALFLMVACGSDRVTQTSREQVDSEASTELSADSDFQPYPGSRWYDPNGERVPFESNVINAITGPGHCDWESGVILHLGWPTGHDAADISESRQYLRDPERVFPEESLMSTYDADAEAPKSADYTGYRTDFMELWLDPRDGSAAYLVFSDHTERWPRAKEPVACA